MLIFCWNKKNLKKKIKEALNLLSSVSGKPKMKLSPVSEVGDWPLSRPKTDAEVNLRSSPKFNKTRIPEKLPIASPDMNSIEETTLPHEKKEFLKRMTKSRVTFAFKRLICNLCGILPLFPFSPSVYSI